MPHHLDQTNDLLIFDQAEPCAKTLGGRLIEGVYNVFSSPLPLSHNDRTSRGQRSDQLAEAMADTVAMLPGIKMGSAGVIRAGLLLEMQGSTASTLGKFGKDAIEGAALNKFASLSFGEGSISRRIESNLGKTLQAESARYAVSGLGIGAIKGGFRSESWFDGEGQLSVGQGSFEISKSALGGAVLAIPGGFIGSRIAGAGLALNAKGLISDRVAFATAGLGSGYFSGAAVGGIQALATGADLSTTARYMHESGIVGALTGATTLSLISSLRPSKMDNLSPKTNEGSVKIAGVDASETYMPKALSELEHRTLTPEVADKLNTPSSRDMSDKTLSNRIAQLGSHKPETLQLSFAKVQVNEAARISPDFSTFTNAGLENRLVPARSYNYKGVNIYVPESYAAGLDEVAKLRIVAAKEKSSEPGERLLALHAKAGLESNPLKDRAHPADFLQALDELPDRSLIKALLIREDKNPSDPFLAKQHGKPEFTAAATAGSDGWVTFYKPERNGNIPYYMKHEWGHLLMWAATPEQALFAKAAELEKEDFQAKKAYYISEYSKFDLDENWAEHTAGLLSNDTNVFLNVAHNAPVRSTVIGAALVKAMSQARINGQGTHNDVLSRRLAYLEHDVLPVVQNDLAYHVTVTKGPRAVLSAELLGRYSSALEHTLLKNTAKNDVDPVLREAAFEAALRKVTEFNARSDDYSHQVLAPSRSAQRQFLLDQMSPNAKSKDLAFSYFSKLTDENLSWYKDLFDIKKDDPAALSKAIRSLESANDRDSQRLAWKYSVDLLDKPNDRVDLALRGLERYPRIREEVTSSLAQDPQERTLPFLSGLKYDSNPRVSRLAEAGIRKFQEETRFKQLTDLVQSDDPTARHNAALKLAETRDMRAAPFIIEAMARSTNPSEQSSMAAAMKTFISPAIWKFHTNRKAATDREIASTLRRALQTPADYRPE